MCRVVLSKSNAYFAQGRRFRVMKRKVRTEIAPLGPFFLGEGYHQVFTVLTAMSDLASEIFRSISIGRENPVLIV